MYPLVPRLEKTSRKSLLISKTNYRDGMTMLSPNLSENSLPGHRILQTLASNWVVSVHSSEQQPTFQLLEQHRQS